MLVFSAADDLSIVQQMLFVVGTKGKVFRDRDVAEHFVRACCATRFVYRLMHLPVVTEVLTCS
jgi:hypothetical protein